MVKKDQARYAKGKEQPFCEDEAHLSLHFPQDMLLAPYNVNKTLSRRIEAYFIGHCPNEVKPLASMN